MTVSALGYFGLGVSDLPAWREFGTSILGLELIADSQEALRFRADEATWRIAVEATGADDIIYAGFEIGSDAALTSLMSRLAEAGVPIEEDRALAERRGVSRLVRAADPDGLTCEFYCSRVNATFPFRPPLANGGFIADSLGAGHLVMSCSDISVTRRFYEDLLGFQYSDAIDMQLGDLSFRAIFLHCNPRHHTIALVPVKMAKRLHHFMLQVPSLDEVGAALDRVQKAAIPVRATLGKHTNDHMISFYVQTPSGFEAEYGWGAREIDDETWMPEIYDSASMWGHTRHRP